MESGQRVSRKGRKLGSSRRRQMREPADGQDAPVAPESEAWSFQVAAELQDFFRDCGAKERGFVTREDVAVAKLSFLSSEEEPEMIFDWVDVERKGSLSLEEFSSGLKSIFGSGPSTHRLRRRRPMSSKRGSAAASFPALDEVDTEEKEAFLAFMEQLGSNCLFPEQEEIWQLWGKLRQEEPHLAGNLEGFLAKMTSRLQEAQADKEALELTLRKCDSDHHREVQGLYEEMEQQIRREKQQLQAESHSRDLALSSQMQEVLEAKEREVQRLAEGQRELEAQLDHLSTTHQEASSENQHLREAERELAGRLEEVQGQLQVTRGHLKTAKGLVSWQVAETEPREDKAKEEPIPAPQAVSPEETTLPGLFGDNDDWNQLLSGFSSTPLQALQLSWSPPPTPKFSSAPQTPRVVRQISISEPHTPLFSQEASLDLARTPRSSLGRPFTDQEGKAGDPDEKDINSEQPVEPPGVETKEKPRPEPEAHFHWDFPGIPAQESGSLVPATLKMLIPLEDGSPAAPSPPQAPAGSSELFQASDPEDKGPRPGPVPAKPPRQIQVLLQDLHTKVEPALESLGAETITVGPDESPQGPETSTVVLQPAKPGPDKHGHSEGPVGTHGQALRPDGPPALLWQSLEEEAKQGDGGRENMSPGLGAGNSEHPLKDALATAPQHGPPQAQVGAEGPTPAKPLAPGSPFPMGVQPDDEAGPWEPPHTLPTMGGLEAKTKLSSETAQASEHGPPQSREQRTEHRDEDLETNFQETGLPPFPGHFQADKPQTDPDSVFHIIFLGDSNVGKTSFLHLLHQDSFATRLTATVGVDFRVKTLLVDNKRFALQLWDIAGQERYHSMTRQLLRKADGVVLMYDITDPESFTHVRYWLDCLQEAGADQAVVLLLGNKTDCEEERQVPTEIGQQLAKELGVSFAECSAALGHNILEPVVNLTRSLKMQEDHMKSLLVELPPERPPKKAGCCF
ncbi:PREDICTED: ras-related protein Rab-44-like [Elephantulus edwardii]|uniref:ras-related protein Rab-44-like n=1 Tax=Elephantulus edwardii TaxID=28737 RepID=UPI0003F06552|nr:PREDICTED: ras-related protein Rab-44-like [Elephantulus edwardii]